VGNPGPAPPARHLRLAADLRLPAAQADAIREAAELIRTEILERKTP